MAAFLDDLLKPLRRKVAPTKRGGAPGFAVWGGYVQTNEKESELTGVQKYATYSDLVANISIIGASVRYFLNLVAKAEWKVEPPEDAGAEGEDIAELLEEMMEDMETPWHRVVRRSALYKFHGFGMQEWTAKRRDDGKIGLLDIEARPQATIEGWDVDENGTVVGVTQRSPQTSELLYLPRTKLVYLVDDALNDTPEGLGLFRHLAEPAKRLQRLQTLEMFGHDTDLRGIPVARAPLAELQQAVANGDMTEAAAAAVVAPLREFIQKHIVNPEMGMLLDSKTYESSDESASPSGTPQFNLELLRGDGGGSTESVNMSIERVTREISRIMGTEFLLLGGDGKGSLALSRDKTNSFALLVDSALAEITESFEKDVFDPLFTLNGWDEKNKPQAKTESIQFRDIEQITRALVDMANAGATLAPDDEAINEIRDLLGLSHAEMRTMMEDAQMNMKLNGGDPNDPNNDNPFGGNEEGPPSDEEGPSSDGEEDPADEKDDEKAEQDADDSGPGKPKAKAKKKGRKNGSS